MVDHVVQEVSGKLVTLVILIIAGIVVTVVRIISRSAAKASQNNLINKLKRDKKKAIEIVNALDFPYGRILMSIESFNLLTKRLSSLSVLGPYDIPYAVSAGTDGLLVLTEIEFTDFALSYKGVADDVPDKAIHNFYLKYDKTSSEVTIWSDGFSDTTNKFQKQDFVKYMRELVAKWCLT